VNSYEIWTIRRLKIKQKKKLMKTLIWLLNKSNIIEINWIGQKNIIKHVLVTWRNFDPLHNFKHKNWNPNQMILEKSQIWYMVPLYPIRNRSQFIDHSLMPRYQEPVYDQFIAKFKSEFKPQSNNIKRSPNLTYRAISPPSNQYIKF